MVHKTQTSYYHTLDKGSSVLIWSLPFLDYTTHFHLDVRNMDLGATVVLTFRWSCNPEMECVFSPLIASSFLVASRSRRLLFLLSFSFFLSSGDVFLTSNISWFIDLEVCYMCILNVFFCQIKSFIRFRLVFVFGLQTL